MGAKGVVVFPLGKPAKLLKWAVEEGSFVSIGRVLLFYNTDVDSEKSAKQKLKAKTVGVVRKLLVNEGEIIDPGKELLELDGCTHPTVMNSMCAECGIDLKEDDKVESNASVPIVHSIPDLKVSKEQAEILGKADKERLIEERRLVLLVDLDQTLIHTTNDNVPPNMKDVYHFQLYGSSSPWYHTRIRPGTHKFLGEITRYYELHICTFGARNYAHMIAAFLDPDGKYFSHRILSRDECFSSNTKTANLKALFPCGDNLVCIIDDREDVWNFAPNLIHVKPYHFFQHTGDINAPPGLTKCENDDRGAYDVKKLGGRELLQTESELRKSEKTACSEKGAEGVLGKSTESCEEASENLKENTTEEKAATENDKTEKGENAVKSTAVEPDNDSSRETKDVEAESEKVAEISKKNEDEANTNVDVEKPKRKGIKKESRSLRTEKSKEVNKKNSETVKEQKQKKTDVASLKRKDKQKVKETVKKAPPKTKEPTGQPKAADKHTKKSGDLGDISEDAEIEVEDDDDYLIYLEEILKTIHKSFYELYDKFPRDLPDLKSVIPYVRRKVLAGTSLVFSGLVPTHVPLERSRAYQVAVQLGAVVTPDLTDDTTHLVAVRQGTAKVNTVQRARGGVLLVTPEWLWTCAERWEHVEERLFPLGRGTSARRHPPAHCASPTRVPPNYVMPLEEQLAQQKGADGVLDIVNPLMTFSSEDIASMDREVEDIFNESESESEVETDKNDDTVDSDKDDDTPGSCPVNMFGSDDSSSSSSESLTVESPHGWKHHEEFKREKRRAREAFDEEDLVNDSPSAKFRRGEELPSDLDMGSADDDESASNDGSDEPPDEIDDGEWNMMGAALEREFLSGSD